MICFSFTNRVVYTYKNCYKIKACTNIRVKNPVKPTNIIRYNKIVHTKLVTNFKETSIRMQYVNCPLKTTAVDNDSQVRRSKTNELS